MSNYTITVGKLMQNINEIYESLPTVYLKGGYGQYLNDTNYNYLYNQYSWNRSHMNASYKKKYAVDCVCFIKGVAYWGWTASKQPKYNANYDMTDATMGNLLTECCAVNDAPAGYGLWKNGHIGISIGNGYCIDANFTTAQNGLAKHKISDCGWVKAGKLPYVDYSEYDTNSSSSSSETVKVGDVIPMVVYEIKDGYAYGKVQISEKPIAKELKVGCKVTISSGAVYGGSSKGTKVPSNYANGKWQGTVSKIQKNADQEEALIKELVSWIPTKYLKVV